MHATPPTLPPLRRVPPGVWTMLAWAAATVYSFVRWIRLPGEPEGLFLARPWWLPPGNRPFLVTAAVMAVIGSCLLRRRALPALALLLFGALCGAMTRNSGGVNVMQYLPVDIGLGFIAATRSRRVSAVAAVLALAVPAGYAATRLALHFTIDTSAELAVALTVVVAWLIGNSARQSRDHARQLAEHAAARAVTAERLRIARELHDMVAHSIGIIALQSGAAARVIDTQPVRARTALTEVENTSRETLSGLRRMLGALREADRAPAPGLADLDRLAAATTAAGVHVDVRWRGEPGAALPPEIDLSAFRIIQESVTNVVRHAGTGSCRVTVDCRQEGELSIEVTDDGRGRGGTPGPAGTPGAVGAPATTATGYGLIGMRERVSLLHGDFSARPRPEGGFRVAARLPVPVPEGAR